MKRIQHIAAYHAPTEFGPFACSLFRYAAMRSQRIAVTFRSAQAEPTPDGVLRLRLQYGCFHGTACFATDCDCGAQWRSAMAAAAQDARMLLIHYRDHEGYGIGIAHKMRYMRAQQTEGVGFDDYLKDIGIGTLPSIAWTVPHILRTLGLERRHIRLLTGNPQKLQELRDAGVAIEAVEPDWRGP